MKRFATLVFVGLALVFPDFASAATPSNRELAHHYAERNAVMLAFDQRLSAFYVDAPGQLLGYLFDGCHRAAPRRFICGVGIGVAYGPTKFVHRLKVRVTFRRGRVTVRRLWPTATVTLATDEQFTNSL